MTTTSTAHLGRRDNIPLHRAMLTLVAAAALGFLLANAVFGFNFADKTLIIHVHAVVMSSWLALLVLQSHLGSHQSIQLHRRVGWFGAALAGLVVITGLLSVYYKLSYEGPPPIFTPGYFLMLGVMNIAMFAAFVTAAILNRRRTAWHRRLMLCSLIVIFEPVLGRVLPFFLVPLLGNPENALENLLANRALLEWVRAGAHAAIVIVVMLVDFRVSGKLHPAYALCLLAVVVFYAVVNGVGTLPTVEAYASSLAQPVASGGS